MNQEKHYRIGEVYWMEFSGIKNEQSGIRPGVVFQNNVGNERSPNIIALPLTASLKKPGQPTHVLIKKETVGLPKDSLVLCENPERMSKERVRDYIATLPPETMAEIAAANLLATSAIAFIDPAMLQDIWKVAVRLNQVS